MKWMLISLALFCFDTVRAQKKKFVSILHLSLAPGISTNGSDAGDHTNYLSANITSGHSGRNELLEVGIISNLNERGTRGLQIGGIANLTGGKAFTGLHSGLVAKKERDGTEANLDGIQVAGIANVVLNGVYGGQLSGGLNVAKGALHGFQISVLSNIVGKYAFGLQVAGLANVAVLSMDGVQIGGAMNVTHGGLSGLQMGMVNRAGSIEGANSFNNDRPSGLQMGLVNQARTMNGFQFGLVNKSKSMQGTQVGMVNIYRNGKSPSTRDGTSIGLINIGSSGYIAMYANDLFLTNIEVATGTLKNRRVYTDTKEKQVQNGLILGVNPAFVGRRGSWAVGYGLKKFYFDRSTVPGYQKFNFVSAGLDLLHFNHEGKKITKALSLIGRPQLAFGSRVHPRNRKVYLFGSVAYNMYYSRGDRRISTMLKETSAEPNGIRHWPGFAVGILVQ